MHAFSAALQKVERARTNVLPLDAIRAVVFDCDGVMFDSRQANLAFYNQILSHFGRPPMSAEQFAHAHMHTVDEALARLFDDPQSLQAAQIYRRRMGYLPFLQFMRIEPELKPLLDWLRPRYRTAVATNRTDTMERVLQENDLQSRFDLVVTALDVARPKPDPEPLLKVLAHFRLEPRQALYVGDSRLDEIAARSAGLILVAYRNASLDADYHIERLGELRKILLDGEPSAGG